MFLGTTLFSRSMVQRWQTSHFLSVVLAPLSNPESNIDALFDHVEPHT